LSPVEAAFGYKEYLKNLYPFGCRVLGYVPATKRNKLETVTRDYVPLKWFENGNYEVRDVENGRSLILRDAKILADEFPLYDNRGGNMSPGWPQPRTGPEK